MQIILFLWKILEHTSVLEADFLELAAALAAAGSKTTRAPEVLGLRIGSDCLFCLFADD